jgi:hypothetical protein
MNFIELFINEPSSTGLRPCTDFKLNYIWGGTGVAEDFELTAAGTYAGKPYWTWVRTTGGGPLNQYLAWDIANGYWIIRDGASAPGSVDRAVLYPTDITSKCPPISTLFQQGQNSAVKDTWQSTYFTDIESEAYAYTNGVGNLDLKNEFDISLQYSIADIKDISKRNAAYSKTMILPGTKNNNYWFGNLFDVNSDFTLFNPNKKTSAKLLVNTQIVIDGFLQLRKIIKSNETDHQGNEVNYEVVIYNNAVDMMSVLGEKTINELDLSQFGHTFSRDNIVDSWDNDYTSGYVYPMFGTHTKDSLYKVEYFYPAIYYRTIIDQMVREAGFGWTGSLLENDQFNKEVISYVTDGRPKIDEEEKERRSFYVGRTVSFTAKPPSSIPILPAGRWPALSTSFPTWNGGTSSRINDETTSPFFDNDNNYNTTNYEWVLDRNGKFQCEGSIRLSLNLTNLSTTQNANAFYVEGGNAIAFTASNPPLFTLSAIVQVWDNDLLTWNGPNSTWDVSDNIVAMGTFITPNNTSQATTDVIFQAPERSLNFGDRVRVAINVKKNNTTAYYTQNLDVSVGVSGGIINGQRMTKFYNKPITAEFTQNEFIDLGDYLPDKIKQKDLLTDLIRRYNLYIQTNPDNPQQLIFDTRPAFYESGEVRDWTQKKDYSSDDEIELLSDLQSKLMIWSYKSDNDLYNKEYQDTTGDVYGQYKYFFDNDFVKGEERIESTFSPTPLVKTAFGAIVPGINPETPKVQPRIFYWGGLRDCNGWTWNYQVPLQTLGVTESFTQYPYAGHFDDPIQPTVDINFGANKYLFYNDWEFVTGNNMFNIYWSDYIRQIEDGRLVTSNFYLDETDINYIKDNFNTKIFILDSYYYVNKIIDYKPLQNGLTKVELLKIVDGVRWEPKKSTARVIERGDGKPYNDFADISVGVGNKLPGGGVAVGNNNTLGGSKGGVSRGMTSFSGFNKNMAVGDGNTVLSNGSMAIGDNNTVIGDYSSVLGGDNNFIDANSVVLIGTTNITATTSNVIYIGNNFTVDSISGSFSVGSQSFTPGSGATGATGATGADGPQGPTGSQGIQGIQGPTGSQGIQGIQGPTGATGNTVLNDIKPPTSGVGVNGDFFINTSTSVIYGPKSGGVWPAGVSLKGATGSNGLTGATGPTGPAGATGSGTSYIYYNENTITKTAAISVTASDRTGSLIIATNSFVIGNENTSSLTNASISYSKSTDELNVIVSDSTQNVYLKTSYDWGNFELLNEVSGGTVSNDRTSLTQDNTNWTAKYIGPVGHPIPTPTTISELKVGSGGITLNVPGVSSEIYIQNIPTSSSGLGSGAIFTQTAAQLGGTGSTKVICIV